MTGFRKSAIDLANDVDVDPIGLTRLLDRMSSLKVVTAFKGEDAKISYSLAPSGYYLLKSHPESLRDIILLEGEFLYEKWSNLLPDLKKKVFFLSFPLPFCH